MKLSICMVVNDVQNVQLNMYSVNLEERPRERGCRQNGDCRTLKKITAKLYKHFFGLEETEITLVLIFCQSFL